jgi:multisubunit Na+/H+ antiporter MnhE subunit
MEDRFTIACLAFVLGLMTATVIEGFGGSLLLKPFAAWEWWRLVMLALCVTITAAGTGIMVFASRRHL